MRIAVSGEGLLSPASMLQYDGCVIPTCIATISWVNPLSFRIAFSHSKLFSPFQMPYSYMKAQAHYIVNSYWLKKLHCFTFLLAI